MKTDKNNYMKQAIKGFINQLKFEPVVENKNKLKKYKEFVVCGMGGSHLSADLLKVWDPFLNVIIHHNYGLPATELKNKLIILSSYSGNTEEVLNSFKEAISKKLPIACISIGGELLKLAEENKVPYIKMPDTGIEPRSALGFSIVSLLKIMNQEEALLEIKKSADFFNMENLEKEGKLLAERLRGHIPIIYASTENESVAYNWKIRFNETGKIPAFYNTFPELNHNEMVGFDREGKTHNLSKYFYFLFLKNKDDHPRNILRMEITKEICQEKKMPVEVIEFSGSSIWEKIFSSLLLADWTAFYIAGYYELKAQEIEIINRFKKILKER